MPKGTLDSFVLMAISSPRYQTSTAISELLFCMRSIAASREYPQDHMNNGGWCATTTLQRIPARISVFFPWEASCNGENANLMDDFRSVRINRARSLVNVVSFPRTFMKYIGNPEYETKLVLFILDLISKLYNSEI